MSWTALGRPDPGAWIPALHEPPLISLGNGAGWGRGGEYWSSWLGPSPRSPPSSPSCPLCVALESPVWQVEGPRLVYNPWQTTCPESHGQLPAKPGKIQDVRGPRRKRFLSLASESERRGGGAADLAVKVRGVAGSSLSAALPVFPLHWSFPLIFASLRAARPSSCCWRADRSTATPVWKLRRPFTIPSTPAGERQESSLLHAGRGQLLPSDWTSSATGQTRCWNRQPREDKQTRPSKN